MAMAPTYVAMRFLTTLVLLAAFLLNVPGLHAWDLTHVHGPTGQVETLVALTPAHDHAHTGPVGLDCHHECSHIHVADHVRTTRVAEPVTWGLATYPADAPWHHAGAEPALPDEPPRA